MGLPQRYIVLSAVLLFSDVCSRLVQINYPYVEKQGECKDKLVKAVSGITGFRRMRPYDQKNIVHVLHRTPVAVGIAGTASSFLMYRGGIYNDKSCGDTLNHAALLVGYGTTNTGHYTTYYSYTVGMTP